MYSEITLSASDASSSTEINWFFLLLLLTFWISSLKAVLPNDAGFVAQAKVDAWASLGNTTQDEILSEQLGYVKNDIQSIEKINKSIIKENEDITGAISKLKTGNTSNLSLLSILFTFIFINNIYF